MAKNHPTLDNNHNNNSNNNQKEQSYWTEVHETLILVASLPSQFYLVLILEFLNSFRTAALRFVLFNYITNEFQFSDKDAGAVLGIKGLLDVVFGLMGSILVDLVGVRMTSLVALSVAFVGRLLLCVSRSSIGLYVALFFFSPCGEALLGTGLYRVALKKLSTPRTRPFVFGLSYAVNNLAALTADICITLMRSNTNDSNNKSADDTVVLGMVFTPTRKFMILSLLSIFISIIIAAKWLRDVTIASVLDPEEGVIIPFDQAKDTNIFCTCFFSPNKTSGYKEYPTENGIMTLKSKLQPLPQDEGEEEERSILQITNRTTRFKLIIVIVGESMLWLFQQVKELLLLTNTWRLLIFGFLVVPVGMQWAATEYIMIPFIERHFGENAPMYMIQSINFAGCLIFPPIVSALTTHLDDDFTLILPGLWIMAVAPIILVMTPTILGACFWQVTLTIGDVFWSPRVLSWTARLAPTGKEGLFFALATTRAILVPLTDFFLGCLNSLYNPNCQDCRDDYGHFCSTPQVLINTTTNQEYVICVSQEQPCNSLLLPPVANNNTSALSSCPSTCTECPGWESHSQKLWSIILFLSLSSPFIVWLFLPFFQGVKNVNDHFYGLLDCRIHRLYSIFTGYVPNTTKQSYERIRKTSSTTTSDFVFQTTKQHDQTEIDDEYEYQ